MYNILLEKSTLPVPFSTDFEVGLTWGDLSGTEFNYNEDITSKKLLQREMKDDTMKYYSWDEIKEILIESFDKIV